jgi:hypothetical protein
MKKFWRVFSALTLLGGIVVWVGQDASEPADAGATGASREAALQPAPVAVASETFHNLGVIDPTDECEHEFVIRNEGNAPLRLARGGTSCDCTMSHLPEGEIPPGAQVPVRVTTKLDKQEGEFNHSASILTNDPKRPSIALRIAGVVRKYVAAHPPGLSLGSIKRGQPQSAETVVYSEVWDDFNISDVRASNPELEWEIAAVEPASLQSLGAKSGHRIKVTLPPRTSSGSIHERLELLASPGADAPARSLVIDIAALVKSRMYLEGPKYNGVLGVLNLGPLAFGEGASSRLIWTVNDEHRHLEIKEIQVDPPFLRVDAAPIGKEGIRFGIYRIEVTVPKDAPTCNYCIEKAKVVVLTDHPVIPRVSFQAAFAIASPQ